jgi:hypothetical protein
MLGIRYAREFPRETQPESVASDESDDDFDPEDEVEYDVDPIDGIEVDWTAEFLSITQWLENVKCYLPRTIPMHQPDVERLFNEFAEYPLVSELLLQTDAAVSVDMISAVIEDGMQDEVVEEVLEEVEEVDEEEEVKQELVEEVLEEVEEVDEEEEVKQELVEDAELKEEEVQQNDPSIRSGLTKTTFNVFSEYGDCLAIDEEVKLQPVSVQTVCPLEGLVVGVPRPIQSAKDTANILFQPTELTFQATPVDILCSSEGMVVRAPSSQTRIAVTPLLMIYPSLPPITSPTTLHPHPARAN